MKVITEHPIAIDSPDHLISHNQALALAEAGTARDNTTDLGFIQEIEAYFQFKKIKTLDVGCSGGQLTIDFCERGHDAIGIEGSDYSIKNSRANWPMYYNKKLFTCDATKPYKIVDEGGKNVIFDLITAWEVIEHIHMNDMDAFWGNIKNHMNENSIFCGSIAPVPCTQEGYVLHQTVYPEEIWSNKILNKYFSVVEKLPFENKVRYGDSFHVLLKI